MVRQAVKINISKHDTTYSIKDVKQVPSLFLDAVVDTEDERFYRHIGIDLIGIGRSIWMDIRQGQLSEGGSTISQQLIRNTILTQEKTWQRKIKEMIFAVALERSMSKQEILQHYLNVVYFGHGAYGAEQAAHTYFGKSISELSLVEWSVLAGLPNAPSAYDPYKAKDLAKKRQRQVLSKLVKNNRITQQEADRTARKKLELQTADQ